MASFVDTNVLLYAVSTADDEAAKRSVARMIMTSYLNEGIPTK